MNICISDIPVASISVRERGKQTNPSNSVLGGSIDVLEGSALTFRCEIEANPPAYNITWYHNVSMEKKLNLKSN